MQKFLRPVTNPLISPPLSKTYHVHDHADTDGLYKLSVPAASGTGEYHPAEIPITLRRAASKLGESDADSDADLQAADAGAHAEAESQDDLTPRPIPLYKGGDA